MASSAAQRRRLYAKFKRHMASHMVALLWEARGAWFAESKVLNWVTGTEGAPLDAGLLVCKEGVGSLPQDASDRLAFALKYRNVNIVVLLDFKTIAPDLSPRSRGSFYRYRLRMTETQNEQCAAFLVQNPAAPAWVAVVPKFYVAAWKGRGREVKGGYWVMTVAMPLLDQPPEHFPMIWGPFVLPFRMLATALASLEAYTRDSARTWHNPYNGLIFEDCPQPRLHATTALLQQNSHSDFQYLEGIREGFSLSGELYRYEKMTLRSGGTDFQLVHIASGERLAIQLKRKLVSIDYSGTIRHTSHYPQPFFTPLTCWDWLLSVDRSRGLALFVSRDDLPQHWFQGRPTNGEQLKWKLKPKELPNYTVKWDRGTLKEAVRGIERLLDLRRRAHGSCAAKIERPFVPGTVSDIEDIFDGVSDEEDDGSKPSEPPCCPPRRGTGRRWSRKQFEAGQTRWLRGLCQKKQYGAVYDLGIHPSGTHAFVPGHWEDEQQPSFFELAPHTRILFLNFAQTQTLEQVGMGDRRRAVQFMHATHGICPSIYVLSPYPRDLEGLGLYRYLVPSKIIAANKKRQEANQSAVEVGWVNVPRNARPIVSRDAEFIQDFAVREDDIVDELRRFLEARPATIDSGSNNLRGTNPREYVSTQREALRQYIPYQLGRVDFLKTFEIDDPAE